MPVSTPGRKVSAFSRWVGAPALSILVCSSVALTGCSGEDGSSSSSSPPSSCDLRPSAANTGASGTLRDDDTTVIDENGATLENVRVPALEIRARDVTLRNVEVDGNILVTGDDAMIDHVTTTGIAISSASGATVQYTNVSHSKEDGIHITSDGGSLVRDVVLEHNFVHSPVLPPEAHYDGTQVRGVDGLLVECSTYDPGRYQSTYNAAIYLEDANGGDSNVTIKDNWLVGSGFSVMVDAPGTKIIGNRVGGDPHWGSCYLGTGTAVQSLTMRNNVDEASGDTDPMCAEAATTAPSG